MLSEVNINPVSIAPQKKISPPPEIMSAKHILCQIYKTFQVTWINVKLEVYKTRLIYYDVTAN